MGEKAIKKVAKKMIMRKVLGCLVIIAILVSAVPVSVFAVNDSNNSTGNASNRSNENLLEKSFTENNSAEMMIPLFTNNTTGKYRAATWTGDDNSSGDCAPIPDADMPEIYLNDTQESVASRDSGNDTVAAVMPEVSNDTDKNVSALSCSVYIKIDDDTCVGYEVYVDGVYKLTEGEGETPDGYCAFYVSAGTHKFELRKNGCSTSKSWDCQCGTVYRWVSMPDYWCECGDQEGSVEVKFRGTATTDEDKVECCICYGSYYCKVKVEELLSNPGNRLKVGNEYVVCYGNSPKNIKTGDKLEVYGEYFHTCGPLQYVGNIIAFDNDYYIKKIGSPESLSISIWTDKSEYKIGETVKIYYKTNKKCTAKLTITKPDGGKVVYGPNEIPACTRSKSPTAGYPTGKRTVVFEAWAGDEYKKATCYFDVVEEELVCDVTFEGTITEIYNKDSPHWYDAKIKVTKVTDDPSHTLDVNEIVNVYRANEDAYEEEVSVNDLVEVCAEYNSKYEDSGYALRDWQHHIKKIEEKKPDLVIQDITWSPSDPKEGDDVEFTITVKNQGKGRADESWLGFRFFPPYIPVGSEVRLRCPPLDSGETASLYDTINLSTCGKYTFKATADARKDIKESREDNNEKAAIINIECPVKKPDLIIQDITWKPENPKQGDNVEFTITVKNQESESAGAFYVYYYIDDSYVDHDYVSLLSAGSTSAQTFTWTADKCGNVEVKAVADATNTVTESNEENNQRVETINIGCPPKEKPDLIISDFYWSPPYPPRGGRVDFFVTVKNIGALASKSCMLKLEFGDFSYSRQVASLRSGKEVTYQIPFNPTKDGEPKTTRGIVEAIVDVNNEIYEDDETNNRKEKLICDYIGEIIERVKNGEDLRGQMFLVHGICFGTAPELPPALPKKLLCGDLPGEGTYVKKNNQVPFLPVCPYKGASLEIGDDVLIGGVLQEDFSIYKYHLFPSLFRKYPLANDFISVKQVTETLPLGVFSTIGAIAKERIVQNNAIFLGVGAGGIGTQDTYTVWFKVPSDMENIPITGIVQVRGKIIRSAGGKIPYYIEPVQDGIKPLWGETWSREEILLHIECPVHITITDQYGRAISDMVANNIPGATVSVVNEEKTFRLPANLKYSVEISAYDTGTFNFTRFSPFGNDISITKFENIPVTSNTKASVEIEPGVTDYTMSIDYNGDGVTDEEKSPDVSETVEVTTPTSIVFEDDFGELNLDNWIPFGTPSPRVLASVEGRTGVFDNNGDGWCNSGVVSKDNFSFPNGFTMESDMYLKVTNVAGCWNSPVIGLTRKDTPTGEGVCPSEDYPMGVIFGTEYDGDACWATPPEKRRHAYFIIGLYTEEGTWESVSWLNADDYTDAWHNFKIAVGSDRIVKFYVDNELIYTSENKINKEILDGKKIFLGIRSSGSAGKSYHDYVKVYATTPSTSNNIIYVPDDYPTIQQAVNAANSGDTIIVRDGFYNENIDVNKPHLTIRSENGAENCVVQAAYSNDSVFEVTADYETISGFTVEGASAKTCSWNAETYFISAGICLANIEYCNILNNNMSNNTWIDIFVYYSNNNSIMNNNVSSSGFSFLLQCSNNNNIYLNNFLKTGHTTYASRIYSDESTNTWNSPSKITWTYNGNTYTNYMGNYRDDYTGLDANGDGIGDTAYNINSDNKDLYPLIEPYENYHISMFSGGNAK